MSAEGYFTVFDVTTAGFKSWEFSAFGLIFVAVGLALPTLVKRGVFGEPSPLMKKWFPPFFLGFAILWTLVNFIATFGDYRTAVDALQNNRAKVVEGVVTQFKPMPSTGHAMESFVVHGVKFMYSDYVITAGFNNTASHGGPIREGLPVKIWYVNGEILRLDVKTEPSSMHEGPVDVFRMFFIAWVALGVLSFIFFHLNRNAPLKRTLWPPFVVAVGILFVVFTWRMSFRGTALYVIIAAVILITILNIRRTKFCTSCGRTLYNQTTFSSPEFCPKCGSKLT